MVLPLFVTANHFLEPLGSLTFLFRLVINYRHVNRSTVQICIKPSIRRTGVELFDFLVFRKSFGLIVAKSGVWDELTLLYCMKLNPSILMLDVNNVLPTPYNDRKMKICLRFRLSWEHDRKKNSRKKKVNFQNNVCVSSQKSCMRKEEGATVAASHLPFLSWPLRFVLPSTQNADFQTSDWLSKTDDSNTKMQMSLRKQPKTQECKWHKQLFIAYF